MKKLCFVDRIGPHYRSEVFQLIDRSFPTDFFFGDATDGIKTLDYRLLSNVTVLHTIRGRHLSFQKGFVSLLYKPYSHYVLPGETRSVSLWLFLLIAMFFPKKQVYLWSHGFYGRESFGEKLLKRVLFSLPNGGTFVYGDYAKRLMIKAGINSQKIIPIYNSLAYSKQLSIRNQIREKQIYQAHFENSFPTVIAICRIEKRKKVDLLIDVLSLYPNLNLVLVGSGSYLPIIKEMTSNKGLEKRVWFYGACYDEYKNAELLYNADLCVIPGDIGLTAIHSLMFGTPVITHDRFSSQGPEFEAIVPDISGAFYHFGDAAHLVSVIRNWFRGHNNRIEIRTKCYEIVDTKWNPDNQVRILKQHISLEN